MKVIKELSQNYPDCIVTYFNYEKYVDKYEDLEEDVALFIGYSHQVDDTLVKLYKDYDVKIYFNGESPCAFTGEKGLISCDLKENFSDVYTICPYTADWANKKYGGGDHKFRPTLFAIDTKGLTGGNWGAFLDQFPKTYDAIFYGGIHGQDHVDIVKAISRFNYKFITLGWQTWNPNVRVKWDNEPGVASARLSFDAITDTNISTFKKWEILAQTKVVPIFNQLYLHDKHVESIKTYEDWKLNEAWSHIDQKIAPQLKPRVTEAGLFKMLMIVKRDPWNVIEHWYEPGKDFLYFDSNDEMEGMIEDISKNWEKYQHIVDSAYEKAIANYTTEALLDKMVRESVARIP